MVKSLQKGILKEKPIQAGGNDIGAAIAIDHICDHGFSVQKLLSMGVKHFDPLAADAEMAVADVSRLQGDQSIDAFNSRFQEKLWRGGRAQIFMTRRQGYMDPAGFPHKQVRGIR